MSRFYHVLNDPRKCVKCNAACAIFGQRDPETSWHYWCTLCNKTWHNRSIENTLFAVSRTFAKHSIATLVGGENTALAVLTFLQISIDCIRYNYHLRHRLETQVLEWICCPLAWYYESDRERIFHPTLRTLQETFIHSTTFKATCFPCSGSDKPWTLLHAVCTFVKKCQLLTLVVLFQNVNVHGACSGGPTSHGYGMRQQMNTSTSTIPQQNGNVTPFIEEDKNSTTGQLENAGS